MATSLIRYRSLNELIDELKSFSDRHKQIEDFGYGEISDIERTSSLSYPAMWAFLDSATITSNGRNSHSSMNYLFSIIIMDEVDRDRTMMSEVQSDAMSILNDLRNEINNNSFFKEKQIEITGDISITPFVDEFASYVSGARAEMNFNIPISFCFDEAPLKKRS